MAGGFLTLVAKGIGKTPCFPPIPDDIAKLISDLIHSEEIGEFQNLFHLDALPKENLPSIPRGYFWYKNGKSWTIRKFRHAPEVVIDLDIFLQQGVFVGYNLSINKNLVDGLHQTDKTLKYKPKRSYGGFEVKDFKNVETGFSETRGHGRAYLDSTGGVDKKNCTIHSDIIPRNYSPEGSTRTGGSDYGQNIRNFQLEDFVREADGFYREINQFSHTTGQVYCGLFVPDIKHAIRILPRQLVDYAVFRPHEIVKLDKTTGETGEDVWERHRRHIQHIPKAAVLSLTSSVNGTTSTNLGYGYFLTHQEILSFQNACRLEIGTQFFVDNDNECRVIIGREKIGDVFEYTYYEFKRLIHLPIAVYLSKGSLANYGLREIDDLDNDYVTKFLPLSKSLNALEHKCSEVIHYINRYFVELKRIFTPSSSTSKDPNKMEGKNIRKEDIRELSINVLTHVRLAKALHLRAREHLIWHTTERKEMINSCKAFSSLRENTECLNTFSEICHAIQKIDTEAIGKIEESIEKVEYELRCVYAVLLPPNVAPRPSPSFIEPSYRWNNQASFNAVTEAMIATGIEDGDLIIVNDIEYIIKKQASSCAPTDQNPQGHIFLAVLKKRGG